MSESMASLLENDEWWFCIVFLEIVGRSLCVEKCVFGLCLFYGVSGRISEGLIDCSERMTNISSQVKPIAVPASV